MTWHFIKIKRYTFGLFTSIIIVIIVGIITSILSINYAKDKVRTTLLEKTNIIANVLDADDIQYLNGNIEDKDTIYYSDLKNKLSKLKEINNDIRFVYITGIKNGTIFFFADSESDNSPDSSPPGQIYSEASVIFKKVFTDKISYYEGPISDRWGSWISAFSPIIISNEVLAVVGIDIDSKDYYQTLIIYGSIPLLISLLISSFILFLYKIHKKEDEFLSLKSELVSIAAHDLRTPLIGLKWSLDSIVDYSNSNLNKDQIDTFKLMQETSNTLLETANQILETSKVENQGVKALDFEKCNLRELLNETISLYSFASKEKNIRIILNSNFPEKININCDKIKIKRVFSNLISNALKYSHTGSEIKFDYKDNNDKCIISISDQGIGISEKDKNNIFKEYFRTHNALQTSYGTGLGLYYVKKIIELHGGNIKLESEINKGTTFYIELEKYI